MNNPDLKKVGTLNVNKKDAQICFIKCFEPVFN